jgi:SAM-dependent methyltransferase
MGEWFENEDLWRQLYPFIFASDRFAEAADEVTSVLELTGFGGKRVLDLCCGPGRHSVELARRGFEVTGVDRSPYLLERAQTRASAAGADVEWILDDMRSFRREEGFELAINMYTSFGYTSRACDDLDILQNLRDSLVPGGSLLIELMGKEVLASIYTRVGMAEDGDGGRLFMVRDVEEDYSGMSNTWVLVRNGTAREYSFSHRLYSAVEMRQMLKRAGFEEVRIYGGLDGTPYGPRAVRLVAVASVPVQDRESGAGS